MSLNAAILLFISACLHTGWNIIGKKVSPSASFFFLANTAAIAFLSPLFIAHTEIWQHLTNDFWVLLVGSGSFQAIYMWGLAGAYRHGAISIAYPILRATPVLMVTLLTLLLGEGAPLTLWVLSGILMVVTGCMLLPITNIRNFSMTQFINRSCLFAFIGALGTAGYTILDNKAMTLLRQSEQLDLSVTELSLIYLFSIGIACNFWLSLFILTSASERKLISNITFRYFWKAIITGALMTLTYSLVLISMAFVENVSYVVAFRQLSIPLTVFFGIYLLKEAHSLTTFIGMTLTFGGLILISLG